MLPFFRRTLSQRFREKVMWKSLTFCCRSGPHQCPVVAPNYADCRSCHYGIPVSSSVHLTSWALWKNPNIKKKRVSGFIHPQWCQRISNAWAFRCIMVWIENAIWTLNIKMANMSHWIFPTLPRMPGQFQSRSLTTHKPLAGMFKQRLGISSSQM